MRKLLVAIALLCFVPNVSRETNLSDLRTIVYSMVSADSTNRVLTPTVLNTFINEAIPILSSDARCIVASKRQLLQVFTDEYYIDSSMVANGVIDVYVKNMDTYLNSVTGLARRDISEFGRSGEKSPNFYDINGYNIYLFNIPNDQMVDDSLVVIYAKIAHSLASDTSTTNIPDDYRLALCYKTCELIFGNRRMESLSGVYGQLYDKEIAKKRSINPPDSLQRIVPNR